MPMPWIPHYAHIDTYSSWDRYDTRAHSPSYSRPSHQYYAAPRRSTFEQSRIKDRFNHKELVQSSIKKKEVVKQVYRVKRDGRKCATSDLISNNKEPIKVLTLATKGNEASQSSAKSEGKKLRVHKVKQELPLLQTKSQSGCHSAYRIGERRNYKNLVHKNLKKGTWHGFPKEVLKIRIMCKLPLQEVRQR